MHFISRHKNFNLKLVFAAVFAIVAFAAIPMSASATVPVTSTSTKVEYFKNACDAVVTPANQSVASGGTASFTVAMQHNVTGAPDLEQALRGCDTGAGKTVPAVNVTIQWEITSGPCVGKTGTATSGSDGNAHFTVTGCSPCAVSQVKISVKKIVTVITTTTKTTVTPVCKSWFFLVCLQWGSDTSTSVSTTSAIYSTFWYDVPGTFTINWTGNCTPPVTPPTGPTPPVTPPTGPTPPVTPPTGPTPPVTPPTGPTPPVCDEQHPELCTPPVTPPSPPVTPSGTPTPSVTIKVAKTCTKPYLLIKPSTKNGTPTSMTVYVDGKRYAKVTGSPLQYKLMQKKLTAGTHTVKVVVRFSNGTVVSTTKKFKPCAKLTANGKASPNFTG